jgi:hypothetical protein
VIEVTKKILVTLELDIIDARQFCNDLKTIPNPGTVTTDLYELLAKNVGVGVPRDAP